MMTQAQWIVLLGLSNAVLGVLFITSLQILKELRKEVHKAYQAKIEQYVLILWTKLFQKLMDVEQFMDEAPIPKKEIELQRFFGAEDEKIERGLGGNKVIEVQFAINAIIATFTEQHIEKGQIIPKLGALSGVVGKLKHLYEMNESASNKLQELSVRGSNIHKLFKEGVDRLKAMSGK